MAEFEENFFPQKLEHEIRLGFIRKTYGILSVQLLITMGVVGLTTGVQAVQDFFLTYFEIFIVAICVNIVCLFTLMCCRKYARKVPTNYILLFSFTLGEAIMVSYVCAAYDPVTILIAAGLTVGVTVVLTAYAVLTRKDYSTKTGIMLVVLFTAILFAILMGVFYDSRPVQIVPFTQVVCCVFVVIYGIYLVIDTQLIVGKGRWSLSMEDYIIGALMLYIDLIGLFLYILRIVGAARR